ncbi:MAG TPA: hypothetical protein PKK06_03000 [Phycisphaerae bacterium]|nr:hypothetical protein [Phycisphaerae bacterium]
MFHGRGRKWRTGCPALLAWGLVVVGLGAGAATAAERVVLGEEFTAIQYPDCQTVGETLSQLMDAYPDSFALVQEHFGDSYAIPWGTQRASFYGVGFVPTTWFSGVVSLPGVWSYAQYESHLLALLATPTDMHIELVAEPIGPANYRVQARVCMDLDGTARNMRIHIVQVLDHWPSSPSYHRNGLKQASASQDIYLTPGGCQVVMRQFAFDAESWANRNDIKIIAWAQEPTSAAPAEVYNAAVMAWPFNMECVLPGQDCWSTECGGTFANFADTPIPTGFFDPGSDPFDGIISLQGATGGIDTVIERLDLMCFPLPLPSSAVVPIALTELNLVSCDPIHVGGSGFWNVEATLAGPAPTGMLMATKMDAAGGTFSASFYVQPVYTFTRVDPPYDTRTFDPGIDILMQTTDDAPWTIDEYYEACSFDGFAGGALRVDRTGAVCCPETCHSSFGAHPHEHCARPAGCPACGACCLPDWTCYVTSEEDCYLEGGEFQGDDTECAGDLNGNGMDDLCEGGGYDQPCQDCGPGSYWVGECPGGYDLMPTAAYVGLDVNFDCVADTHISLTGPALVLRSMPLDYSVYFPGVGNPDGHFDVIDTEIVSMGLTSQDGVILRAGRGLEEVQSTLGAGLESPSEPWVVDSFFDVFFEVQLPSGDALFNQSAVRLEAPIGCVPPIATFVFPTACVPLYTSPLPGQGLHVANLVYVDHETYPLVGACCDDANQTCTENVFEWLCPAPKRFATWQSCYPDPFVPPCGDIIVCPPETRFVPHPPNGITDATQPHPVAGLTPCKGIGEPSGWVPITIDLGVPGAGDMACWELCETGFSPQCGPNAITSVVEGPAGVYTINLAHGISAYDVGAPAPALGVGHVTTIRYNGGAFVRYYKHPGNVDGSSFTNAQDITQLIQRLNIALGGGSVALWEADINQSGTITVADLTTEINLLNGASQYDVWFSTSKPTGVGCP